MQTYVPIICPLHNKYRISSPYGIRIHPITGKKQFHSGIDLAVPLATPVYSTADGEVVYAGLKGGYGRCIIVKHQLGFETLYGHLVAYYVGKGQTVKQNSPIGFVGATGKSTGNHLHYEIRKNGKTIHPIFIKNEVAGRNRTDNTLGYKKERFVKNTQ